MYMYTYVYMCAYLYMYTCIYVCMYMHHGKYLMTDNKTYIYIYICIHVCTFFPISVGKYMGSRGKDMTAAGVSFSVIDDVCCGDDSITVKFVG